MTAHVAVGWIKRGLLLFFLALLSAATAITGAGLHDQLANADAIVVPGNTVGPDGAPSPRLQARLDCALEVYRKGYAPLIFVSGGVGKEGFDEAFAMSQYLVRQGVPRHAVIMDPTGVDTAATAASVAGMGKTRGIRSVIVATQYFHVPRTKILLTQAGVTVVGNVHARYVEPRDIYSLAREVVALGANLAGLG